MGLNIQGVFFDLGGTLFEYDRANNRVGRKLIESLAALPGAERYTSEDLGKAYGRANKAITRHYATLDYYLHADLFRDTYMRAVELLELDFDEARYAEFSLFQHQAIVGGLNVKPDCHTTLEQLKQRGLYLSIVSNIDEDMLQPLVKRESLDSLLNHWTSSEAAQSCKPHRRFFEVSLEKASLDPANVLFVGDSPEHDINGAHALGMRTVLIKNGDLTAPLQSGADVKAADHTVHSLSELLTLV